MEIENITELHEKYKKFMKRSHDHYKELFERIKNDRDFLFGSHYDESDDKRLGKTRMKGQVDIVSNTIRSIVNQYSANPYAWVTNDESVNEGAARFLNESNIKSNIINGLKNGVSYGLGYFVVSTVTDNVGNTVPTMYSIPKVTNVYFDPDSTQVDGSDARQCVIVDIKSKEWIKAEYGEEFITDKGQKPYFDIEESYDEDEMPIITYYVKEKDNVTIYKIINDQLIDEPAYWIMDRLPVVPVYGEEIYLNDDVSYQGIVRQLKPIQKLVDYTYSQLCERLAKSPKNAWVGTKEALEGYEEYYRNFDKSVNPLLIYNKYDGKNNANEAPTRQDMTIQYADLTTLLQNALGLAQNITGVQTMGIPDTRDEITATEALLNVKSFANNIRHYFDNLKESFKSLGCVFMQLMGFNIPVRVEQGPEDEMQRQTARAELMQLTQMVPEEQRMNLIGAITHTMEENEYVRNFANAVFGSESSLPPQVQQQMQGMQDMIAQLQNANKQLQDQLQQSACELLANKESNMVALKTEEMRLQNDMLKFQIEMQYKYGKDAQDNEMKLVTEQLKQNAQNTREAIKSDTEMKKKMMEIQSNDRFLV